MKVRKLLLAAALCAGPAFAQQNVDISGKDFTSGAGDAKFATVGRQAAASGKRIVVTAPQEWHGKIAAKIRAGGAADIVLKDGFYENVLVRVEDKPAEPKPEPKAEPKPEPRPEPKAAPRAPERVPVEVPGPKPTPPAPVPAPAPQPAPVQSAPAPAAAPVKPPVAAAPAPAPAATAAPAKVDVAKIQKRFEQSLNNGREAEGEIAVSNLKSGDLLYVDGPVRAVVRRESLRPRLFWLSGDLDVRRTELKELGTNRYQVIDAIRGENFSLRGERSDQPQQLLASEPADNAPARAAAERDYNEGRPIANSLGVAKLRAGDIVYTGKGFAVVVRREGTALARYWLEGSLDLGQSGLLKDGANKYKVISDILR